MSRRTYHTIPILLYRIELLGRMLERSTSIDGIDSTLIDGCGNTLWAIVRKASPMRNVDFTRIPKVLVATLREVFLTTNRKFEILIIVHVTILIWN